MPGHWRPDWSLRVWGPKAELRIQFPPSYVLAGSATVELLNASSRSSWRYAHNGYQAEWLHLADVAEGRGRTDHRGADSGGRSSLRTRARRRCGRPNPQLMKTPIQLTVALDATDLAVAALHRAVLASLPQRFLVTRKRVGECTDIVVVSGQEPSWMDRIGLALDAGAKGILLATPTAVDPAQVRTLATGGLVVAVDRTVDSDPSWAAAVSDIAVDVRSASLIDSVVTVEDATESSLFAGLVEQVALVRSLLGSFVHLGCIHRTTRQHALVGHSGGTAVSLTAIASETPGSTLRMDVVSAARRWQAHFDDTALARPTEITLYDGNGALSHPLLYASGRRSTWMQLHAAITEQAYPSLTRSKTWQRTWRLSKRRSTGPLRLLQPPVERPPLRRSPPPFLALVELGSWERKGGYECNRRFPTTVRSRSLSMRV